MDVIVRISKEKKEKDFRMVVIPSGRDEIGIIQTKDYGIIAYPDKKDNEKIGEIIYWAFNESDDKVIENSSVTKIEKQFFYNKKKRIFKLLFSKILLILSGYSLNFLSILFDK